MIPPNRQQETQIIEEFRKRRRLQLVMIIPILLMIMPMALSGNRSRPFLGQSENVWLGVGLAGVVIALAVSLKNWRCPACESYLGRGINPKFCHRCGAKLTD